MTSSHFLPRASSSGTIREWGDWYPWVRYERPEDKWLQSEWAATASALNPNAQLPRDTKFPSESHNNPHTPSYPPSGIMQPQFPVLTAASGPSRVSADVRGSSCSSDTEESKGTRNLCPGSHQSKANLALCDTRGVTAV